MKDFPLDEQIAICEQSIQAIDPDENKWYEWIQKAADYGNAFLKSTRSDNAWQPYDINATHPPFSLQNHPENMDAILGECAQWIDHTGLNPASGGHLGYIPGGGLPAAAVGDLLAALTNRYAGVSFANPGAVALEHFLIDWMRREFQLPESAGGTLTSGGSIANLIAVVTARDAAGVHPEEWSKVVIYGSEHMHHCIHKALRIAGLGHSIWRMVPLDDEYRIRPQALQDMIRDDHASGLKPIMIIASAGTTDTGAIDPLNEIASIARHYQLWFHIDAAYGGFFYLLPDSRKKMAGLELADSLVVDPHKGLFLPYGTGAVLVRDVRHLHESHYYIANYMQDAHNAGLGLSPADLSPELTRHFRGLRMYFALRLAGLDHIKSLLRHKLLLTAYFYNALDDLGMEKGPVPDLSVCIYRIPGPPIDANDKNEKLLQSLHADGRVFVSSTTIQDTVWLRLAVLSFRTEKKHIDTLLDMLRTYIPLITAEASDS